MTICPTNTNDPFRCRTKEEYLGQLMTMLPRGRAWQSHDATTSAVLEKWDDYVALCGEAQCGDAQCGQIGLQVSRTVLAAYWAVYAEMEAQYFAQRACELLDEFYCQTVNETRDVWGEDYGFPDECDPWTTLCEKVAAQGGATCDYLTWAASLRGWEVECSDCGGIGNPYAMTGCMMVGPHAYPCYPCVTGTILIRIDVLNSPAYNTLDNPALAGRMMTGCTAFCAPGPQTIECLIERIKPAHVAVEYEYKTAYDLTARNISVSPPEIGEPLLDHDSAFAFDVEVGSPVLGSPTLTEN